MSHGGPIKILLPSLISARGYAGHVNPQGLKIGKYVLADSFGFSFTIVVPRFSN